jgi:hypothetical protein
VFRQSARSSVEETTNLGIEFILPANSFWPPMVGQALANPS